MNLHKWRRESVQKRDKNGKIWEIRRRHDKGWAEVARDHADGDEAGADCIELGADGGEAGADGGEVSADCIELGADEIGTAQFSARSARNQAVPRRNR